MKRHRFSNWGTLVFFILFQLVFIDDAEARRGRFFGGCRGGGCSGGGCSGGGCGSSSGGCGSGGCSSGNCSSGNCQAEPQGHGATAGTSQSGSERPVIASEPQGGLGSRDEVISAEGLSFNPKFPNLCVFSGHVYGRDATDPKRVVRIHMPDGGRNIQGGERTPPQYQLKAEVGQELFDYYRTREQKTQDNPLIQSYLSTHSPQVAAGGLRLLMFTARWCEGCQKLKTKGGVLDQVKRRYPDIPVQEVDNDVDEGKKLFGDFTVQQMPSFVVLDSNGNPMSEVFSGAPSYTALQTISDKIDAARTKLPAPKSTGDETKKLEALANEKPIPCKPEESHDAPSLPQPAPPVPPIDTAGSTASLGELEAQKGELDRLAKTHGPNYEVKLTDDGKFQLCGADLCYAPQPYDKIKEKIAGLKP